MSDMAPTMACVRARARAHVRVCCVRVCCVRVCCVRVCCVRMCCVRVCCVRVHAYYPIGSVLRVGSG